ncbi:S-methyl-5-thioribose-1-phosphate isomerase [Carboxydichorda subterranea]|uniref:S-methyl-5-thioribose-1-phosphate isomerase n=1 Tax=Carboxydichorda subterranea TaxID=3109565 RepID=UPI00385735F6
MVRAYRWDGSSLWLLDQRRLPAEEVWVRCVSAGEVASAIRAMIVRGAPLIGVAAAYGVALAAKEAAGGPFPDGAPAGDRLVSSLEQAAGTLKAARPTAVNLAWAVERVMRRLREALSQEPAGSRGAAATAATAVAPDALARIAEEEARAIASEDEASCWAIGEAGAPLMPEHGGVLTHCNTGALATAGIGTAAGILRRAVARGHSLRIYATETRPYLQGARLTAWELIRDGLDVTLITDNMAGYVMQQGFVQAVVVGADRIAANGDTANKVGTYALAVLAAAHGIPFYVAAPYSTVDLSVSSGAAIPIEERSPEEVTHLAGMPIAPPQVSALHPAFDVTPARLITAIVTDRGVLRPPYESSLARAAAVPPARPSERRVPSS